MVYLGTILLWFGWFGFSKLLKTVISNQILDGGSALQSNARAANAALVTTVAASFGAVTWVIMDYLWGFKKVTGVGFCSGYTYDGLPC